MIASHRELYPRRFLGMLAASAVIGAALRLLTLGHGTLFRDDAWVALTSRTSLANAWHISGASPLYTLAMRVWAGWTASHTWLMQLPTLIVATAGIVLVGLTARYMGLSQRASALASAVVAFSPVAIAYSTHLKPYSHDIFVASALLFTATLFFRSSSPWWFAVTATVSLLTSLTALPFVIGLSLAVVVHAVRLDRLKELVRPAVLLGVPVAFFVALVSGNLSSRLTRSWRANFIDWSSPSSALHSTTTILKGLFGGLVATTPRVGIHGAGTFVLLASIALVLMGMTRRVHRTLPLAGLSVAALACGAGLVPLGTGRTDSYLYPALAILMGAGVEALHTRESRFVRLGAQLTMAAVLIVGVTSLSLHPPRYPGGDIRPALATLDKARGEGAGVIVEGTARWPYVWQSKISWKPVFSNDYNTGFAPLVSVPHTVVMPGSQIEGNFHPLYTVRSMSDYPVIATLRATDWVTPDPLAPALRKSCYALVMSQSWSEYEVDTWHAGHCVR